MNSKKFLWGKINSKQKIKKLKEISEYIFRGKQPTYVKKSKIRTLNQKSIRWGKIEEKHFKYQDPNIDIEERHFIKKNDVVINSTGVGTVGRVYHFKEKPEKLFADSHVTIIRTNKKELLPRFLMYQISTDEYQDMLLNGYLAGSTGQVELNKSKVEELEILVPSIDCQREIVKILSTLDEKIELNNQMNKTLEEMAQTIYKSWFIDFEPFQDGKFIESKLGVIPEGWEVFNIKNKCEVILGGTPARKKIEYWNQGNIPWINSGKINEFRIIEPSEYITEAGLNNSSTKLMPSGTTVLAITGATLGQVSRIEKKFCANQSVIGIIESDLVSSEYIYLFIKDNIEKIIAKQTGGAQQHINKSNVEKTKILIPNEKVIEKFKKTIDPIFISIKNNCFENIVLKEIRDSLLPKLMSGEIRVPLDEE